jgi:site-specific DNA-methyltransferase (adenine-specific)
MINWIVEERKVSELKKWEINPRKISNKGSKELEKSLDKLGNFELLIVNSDNTVIAGNQRLEKFKAKGVDSIKVLVADRLLSEEEVKEIGLRSNLHKGTWDNDLLEMSFKDLIEQLGIDELIKGEEDGFYTRKIETPIYEPRGIEPNVNELIDTTKSD